MKRDMKSVVLALIFLAAYLAFSQFDVRSWLLSVRLGLRSSETQQLAASFGECVCDSGCVGSLPKEYFDLNHFPDKDELQLQFKVFEKINQSVKLSGLEGRFKEVYSNNVVALLILGKAVNKYRLDACPQAAYTPENVLTVVSGISGFFNADREKLKKIARD